MRLISWNAQKRLSTADEVLDFFAASRADCLCLQEIAHPSSFSRIARGLQANGLAMIGTNLNAIVLELASSFGLQRVEWEFEALAKGHSERVAWIDVDVGTAKYRIISCYYPASSRGDWKETCSKVRNKVKSLISPQFDIILAGDMNEHASRSRGRMGIVRLAQCHHLTDVAEFAGESHVASRPSSSTCPDRIFASALPLTQVQSFSIRNDFFQSDLLSDHLPLVLAVNLLTEAAPDLAAVSRSSPWARLLKIELKMDRETGATTPKQSLTKAQAKLWKRVIALRDGSLDDSQPWLERVRRLESSLHDVDTSCCDGIDDVAVRFMGLVRQGVELVDPERARGGKNLLKTPKLWEKLSWRATLVSKRADSTDLTTLREALKTAAKATRHFCESLGAKENEMDAKRFDKVPRSLKSKGFLWSSFQLDSDARFLRDFFDLERDSFGNSFLQVSSWGRQDIETKLQLLQSMLQEPSEEPTWTDFIREARTLKRWLWRRWRFHYRHRLQFMRTMNDLRGLCNLIQGPKDRSPAALYRDPSRSKHTPETVLNDTIQLHQKWLSPHKGTELQTGETVDLDAFSPDRALSQIDSADLQEAHQWMSPLLQDSAYRVDETRLQWDFDGEDTEVHADFGKAVLRGAGKARLGGFHVGVLGRLTSSIMRIGEKLMQWQLHCCHIASCFRQILRILIPKFQGVRPISLQHDMCCLLLSYVHKRLRRVLEKADLPHSSSFAYRPGVGTGEALQLLMSTFDLAAGVGRLLLWFCADEIKFFDRIPHELQLQALRRLGFPEEGFITLVRDSNESRPVHCRTPLGNFDLVAGCGLLQGSPLSCDLVNQVTRILDEAWESDSDAPRIDLTDRFHISCIRYSDDGAKPAESVEALRCILKRAGQRSIVTRIGQHLNGKTRIIANCQAEDWEEDEQVAFPFSSWSYDLEAIARGELCMEFNPSFKHLGLHTTPRGDTSRHREMTAKRMLSALQKGIQHAKEPPEIRMLNNVVALGKLRYAAEVAKWDHDSISRLQSKVSRMLRPALHLCNADTPFLLYLNFESGGAALRSVSQEIAVHLLRETFVAANRTNVPMIQIGVAETIRLARSGNRKNWQNAWPTKNLRTLGDIGIFLRDESKPARNRMLGFLLDRTGREYCVPAEDRKDFSMLYPDPKLESFNDIDEGDIGDEAWSDDWRATIAAEHKRDFRTATCYWECFPSAGSDDEWNLVDFTPASSEASTWYTDEMRAKDRAIMELIMCDSSVSKKIFIATDGSVKSDLPPGWALILADGDDLQIRYMRMMCLPIKWGHTTSTIMMAEMAALVSAFELGAQVSSDYRVSVFTDSHSNQLNFRGFFDGMSDRVRLRGNEGGSSYYHFNRAKSALRSVCPEWDEDPDATSKIDTRGFGNIFLNWVKSHQTGPPWSPSLDIVRLNAKADDIANRATLLPIQPDIRYAPTGLMWSVWIGDKVCNRDPPKELHKLLQRRMLERIKLRDWEGWGARMGSLIDWSKVGWFSLWRCLLQGIAPSHSRRVRRRKNTYGRRHVTAVSNTHSFLSPEACPFCPAEKCIADLLMCCRGQECERMRQRRTAEAVDVDRIIEPGPPDGSHHANDAHLHNFCVNPTIVHKRKVVRAKVIVLGRQLDRLLGTFTDLFPRRWRHEIDESDLAWRGIVPANMQAAWRALTETDRSQIADCYDRFSRALARSARDLQATIMDQLKKYAAKLENANPTTESTDASAPTASDTDNSARAYRGTLNSYFSATQRVTEQEADSSGDSDVESEDSWDSSDDDTPEVIFRCMSFVCEWRARIGLARSKVPSDGAICAECTKMEKAMRAAAAVEQGWPKWPWTNQLKGSTDDRLCERYQACLKARGTQYPAQVWQIVHNFALFVERNGLVYETAVKRLALRRIEPTGFFVPQTDGPRRFIDGSFFARRPSAERMRMEEDAWRIRRGKMPRRFPTRGRPFSRTAVEVGVARTWKRKARQLWPTDSDTSHTWSSGGLSATALHNVSNFFLNALHNKPLLLHLGPGRAWQIAQQINQSRNAAFVIAIKDETSTVFIMDGNRRIFTQKIIRPHSLDLASRQFRTALSGMGWEYLETMCTGIPTGVINVERQRAIIAACICQAARKIAASRTFVQSTSWENLPFYLVICAHSSR